MVPQSLDVLRDQMESGNSLAVGYLLGCIVVVESLMQWLRHWLAQYLVLLIGACIPKGFFCSLDWNGERPPDGSGFTVL